MNLRVPHRLASRLFAEGDKADTGYREIWGSLGFAEAELLVEFGYPTQRFVLQKEKAEEKEDE